MRYKEGFRLQIESRTVINPIYFFKFNYNKKVILEFLKREKRRLRVPKLFF